jgi:hypothetical protein
MKRKIFNLVVGLTWVMVFIPGQSDAQVTEIISLIKTVIKKVVLALDLEVQRIQNKTIWLQDAQKTLENTMSELKLKDISGWVEKQRGLYANYYNELWEVKQIISDYDKLKQIVQLQEKIVSEYKTAYGLFKKDKHFSAPEIEYMYKVYSGILDEGLRNLDQVLLVVNAFVTQMSDAKRMDIINSAQKGIEKNYYDLRQFNNQNMLLSLQRAADDSDARTVKKLYGLE